MPADLVPAAFAARMRELPAEGGPTGEAWVDEIPAAYRDIHRVMEDADDLVDDLQQALASLA